MKLLPEHCIAARGLLRWSQEDLATRSGLSRQTISNFEAGTASPSEDTLLRIFSALESQGIEFMNSGKPGVRHHPEKAR